MTSRARGDRSGRAHGPWLLWAPGLLLIGVALMVAACDSGDGSQEPQVTGVSAASISPSPEAEASETPAAETAVPGGGISGVDFSQVAAVKALLSDSGGRLLSQEIIFADLTGDGVDEAVVPVSSGGSGGSIAYAVFGYRGLAAAMRSHVEPSRSDRLIAAGALRIGGHMFLAFLASLSRPSLSAPSSRMSPGWASSMPAES